jgi:pyruvate ferredoxin oxidoreductase beta subunit
MKIISRKDSLFTGGHTACAGCAGVMAVHQALRVLGKDIIIVNSTGCLEIVSSRYPISPWKVPYIHCLFENASSVATGVLETIKQKGNHHTKVVVMAGDGATYDIGIGPLSGMLERGDDVLYICYNNEAYMNTGIQRSSATPLGAATTTSQAGKEVPGKPEVKKDIVAIAAAHGAYAASSSVAYPADYEKKLAKAKDMKGARFITVHSPCVPGWGISESLTVELARKAVETGLCFLYEIENGKVVINYSPEKFKPVEEYLKPQKRFKHLFKPENKKILKEIEDYRNKSWESLKRRAKY